MPEVAKDGAYFIDPFNTGEIAEAMVAVMNKPDLRDSLIRKGFARSSEFSWQNMAKQVLQLYQNG
jgi:glycosyltransferase involved in cell wall biosynthesis